MIPTSPGILSPESGHITHRDGEDGGRSPTTPQQPTTPRMVQPSPEAEQDGMEVDSPEDEKDRVQDHRRPPKRGRDDDDSEHITHSEPKLKRQRRSPDSSPARSELDQQPSSSSSSSCPSISSSSISNTTATDSSTIGASFKPAKLIHNPIDIDDVYKVVTMYGPDQKEATALLFGEATTEWPEGYSLLQVGPPSPGLAKLLTESGVHLVWKGLTRRGTSEALLLVTPESDRERLKSGLMGMQSDAPTDEPAQADGDPVYSDDDEEFREFPKGKYSTPLMLAAAIGEAETVEALLHQGADPNERNPSGATALMIAAGHNHILAVRALIRDHKTKVYLHNSIGADALCHAAAQGNIQMVSLLLGSGGATLPKERVWHHKHPLFIAARKGHYPICKLLFDQGISIDLEDGVGKSALWHAAETDQTECCKKLLDAGADWKLTPAPTSLYEEDNFLLRSILCVAVKNRNYELLDLLIKCNQWSTLSQIKLPLLHVAATHKHVDMMKYLLQLKIAIDFVDQDFKTTAINVACKKNHTEGAITLLEAGANPDIPDMDRNNGLVHAAGANNIELLKCLLKHGAKLTSKWHFGYLALYQAAGCGHLDAMTLLLSAGAPTSMSDEGYRPRLRFNTLLIQVMNDRAFYESESQLQALNLLMKHGASWREVDVEGRDALVRAVMWGNPPLVPALISNGATVGQKDRYGFNALDIAALRAGDSLRNPGVFSQEEFASIIIFFHILMCAQRQPDWLSLQAGAIKVSEHPIIRELLASNPVTSPQAPAVGKSTLAAIPFDIDGLFRAIFIACRDAGNDWDRTATENILTFKGVPMPVIELYCDYIEALPKIQSKLFGPKAGKQISDAYFRQFFYGIAAVTGKFDIDKHALNDAYEAFGWHSVREGMVSVSRNKILSLVAAKANWVDPLVTVFADLFEDCLGWTLSAREPQGLNLSVPPTPGLIAEKLMHHGVFAALADRVEEAWRAAWIKTFGGAKAIELSSLSSSSSSSSSASRSEVSPGAMSNQHMPLSDTSSKVSNSTLSEELSSQLLSAFREALATKVYSAELMELPGGSAKEGALYADLMHGQLDMTMQFIRPGNVLEDKPASVATAVPEPGPSSAPVSAPALTSEFAPVPPTIPTPALLPSPAPTETTDDHYRPEFWDLGEVESMPSLQELELSQDVLAFDDWLEAPES